MEDVAEGGAEGGLEDGDDVDEDGNLKVRGGESYGESGGSRYRA